MEDHGGELDGAGSAGGDVSGVRGRWEIAGTWSHGDRSLSVGGQSGAVRSRQVRHRIQLLAAVPED